VEWFTLFDAETSSFYCSGRGIRLEKPACGGSGNAKLAWIELEEIPARLSTIKC
jgi:hypothetical protein